MVCITPNNFIDFIHVNKDYRFNLSTQADKATLKQAPELQTIRCTKSGPKHHTCKEKHACKDRRKHGLHNPLHMLLLSLWHSSLVFTDALKFWGVRLEG